MKRLPPPLFRLTNNKLVIKYRRKLFWKEGDNFLKNIYPWLNQLLPAQSRREELMKLLQKIRFLRIAILCSMMVTCLNEICATGRP